MTRTPASLLLTTTGFLFCLGLAACGLSEAELDDNVEPLDDVAGELTGGTAATAAQFKSVVMIAAFDAAGKGSACTAARVGPRAILTAAHCVSTSAGKLDARFAKGGKIYLEDTNSLANVSWEIFTIASSSVAPGPRWGADITKSSDLAVIKLTTDLPPRITTARVRITAAPTVGMGVTMLGYGCEHGAYGPDPSFASHKLKFKLTTVSAVTKTVLNTKGFFVDPKAASLCPGDSGGPLLTRTTTRDVVVGVNSYESISSAKDKLGVGSLNGFGRADVVGAWLKGLGGVTTE